MLGGQWYRPTDAQLARERRACQRRLADFNTHPEPDTPPTPETPETPE